MSEIKSIQDLEKLKQQISTVRLKCKRKAEYKKMGFFERLREGGSVPLEDDCNRHNESAYQDLPQEVVVSPEIAQLLIALFTDHVKENKALDDKEKLMAFKTAGKFITTVIFPNPLSLGSLALDGIKAQRNLGKDEGMDELLRKADINMKEVLGSYQLTKKDDGSFVLKRGAWSVYFEEKVHSVGPMGSKVSTQVHFSALKNIGVDKKLLPAEQQSTIDSFERFPNRSMTMGRWEGRWEEELSR
ncbi:MAG: hypothetical protein LW823_08440 [Rickettsiales bacterium]|nr:hypothetical protein [Rickettsiales bacterium]